MINQVWFISLSVIFALIPFLLVLTTSFTRISITLTFLKQALSTSVPSTHIILALSLILTGYVMQPVFKQVYQEAIVPYMESRSPDSLDLSQAPPFIKKAWNPLQYFMLQHTRESDLQLFLDLSHQSDNVSDSTDLYQIPWYCVMPAFVLSELRTAFMMGFLLFLPFLVIDMVVSSILMSLGMVLLPPLMISFPFKILLFVLVDGWRLILQQLVEGFAR